jgi:4-hydroxybenzoate polyprenyltransferase
MSQLRGLVRTMRPKQWTKNGFVFVPLLFDHKLTDGRYLLATIAGFVLLCLVSSTVYLLNDIVDIEADKAHPTKRHRPLPSGQLSRSVAIAAAIVLTVLTLPLSFLLEPAFGLLEPAFGIVVVSYLVLNLAYSFYLKHIVLIDVMVIAACYVLRVAGGVVLVDVVRFSPWLYIFTTMLALFLGFGKRRHELILLQGDANNHRAILDQYNISLLDEMIMIVSTATILTYALYTFSAEGLPTNHAMMLTIPFVLYIIFRYLYLIHVKGEGGAPDEVILRDRPLQAAVVLGGLAIIVILYVVK